jgi:hypothetical protein
MVAPVSRMGPADDVDGAAKASPLYAKYGTRVDANSAREILAERMNQATAPTQAPAPAASAPAPAQGGPQHTEGAAAAAGGLAAIGGFLNSREGKAITKQVTRGLFGMLKK